MIKSTFKFLFKVLAGVFLIVSKIFDVFAKIFEGIASVFAMFAAIFTIIEESSFDMKKILNKITDLIMPMDFDDDTPPNNVKPDDKKIYDLPQIK